jgi:hypothetical protein
VPMKAEMVAVIPTLNASSDWSRKRQPTQGRGGEDEPGHVQEAEEVDPMMP